MAKKPVTPPPDTTGADITALKDENAKLWLAVKDMSITLMDLSARTRILDANTVETLKRLNKLEEADPRMVRWVLRPLDGPMQDQ